VAANVYDEYDDDECSAADDEWRRVWSKWHDWHEPILDV
jgi:hypothetical protein